MRAFRFALLVAVLLATAASADEGQWTPEQIADLDSAELKRLGLELSAPQLWNDKDGGLLRAAVNFSRCSSGFISKEGLVGTNHHCAYGAIQAASTPEHDYLKEGFIAKTRAEEIEAKGKTIRIISRIEDVTAEIRNAFSGVSDDVARAEIVERKMKEIVARCEKERAPNRCEVAPFYFGAEFRLFEFLELLDVRIVFAPPSSVGNFGGEIDNWMWPRHAADFSLVRAYVGPDGKPATYSPDNVPYHPEHYFPVSAEGVSAGDFVAVLGYPGHTDRYLAFVEVERWLEQGFPGIVTLYREWIDLLQKSAGDDAQKRIKVAAKIRSMANRMKNSEGMLDGLPRMRPMAERKAIDDALAEGPAEQAVLDAMRELSAARRETFDRDFLVKNLLWFGPDALAIAIDLLRWADEGKKPDLERVERYQDREEENRRRDLERHLRDYDPDVDATMLASTLASLGSLPEGQAPRGIDGVDVKRALKGTRLNDPATVWALFKARDRDAIEQSSDPMLVLAKALLPTLLEFERHERAMLGREVITAAEYVSLRKAANQGRPIYPDANGTLRFSYATVTGYSPEDGMLALPQTTLRGAAAKHTGQDPFDLPAAVREKADAAKGTYWADPKLGDVPVCFLSNADTTGGNSGSPVINGKGELVGLNFDRVWENIAGDFGYSPARSRNISVDFRYVLWLLDVVYDAGHLLEEMGVAAHRGQGPRTAAAATVSEGKPAGTEGKPKARVGSCEESPLPLVLAVIGIVGFYYVRRRKPDGA